MSFIEYTFLTSLFFLFLNTSFLHLSFFLFLNKFFLSVVLSLPKIPNAFVVVEA